MSKKNSFLEDTILSRSSKLLGRFDKLYETADDEKELDIAKAEVQLLRLMDNHRKSKDTGLNALRGDLSQLSNEELASLQMHINEND